MADAIEIDNGDSLEQRLYSALGKEDATPMRDLLRTTTQLAIAELKVQLNADAQNALVTLHRYCTRWDAKVPPQPRNTLDNSVPDEPYNAMREFDRARRDPNAYNPIIEFDRERRPHRYEPVPLLPPLPPPPEWGAKPVEELRGTLRGALKQLIAVDQGKSKPTAAASENVPTNNSEVDYVDAMTRYIHSCDEMSTVRLNPRKAIPLDQRPEETPPATGSGNAKKAPRGGLQNKELSDNAVLVLRALPSSSEPALKTLDAIADRIDLNPRPSVSNMSRGVKELRAWVPPLVDTASYRLTRAGENHRTR